MVRSEQGVEDRERERVVGAWERGEGGGEQASRQAGR